MEFHEDLLTASQPPPRLPSDCSDSVADSEPSMPPIIPPTSIEQPSIIHNAADIKPKNYHFDFKLKPESVPQWNGNPDILVGWVSEINHLVDIFPDIEEELGKIIPQQLTDSAETWYYSIPDAERARIEENWTTLSKAISEYWMNRHWVEKQKLREDKVREARRQRETPSEYIIRKM